MALSPETPKGSPACLEQLEKAKSIIQEQQAFIEQVTAKPTAMGTVIGVEHFPVENPMTGEQEQRRFIDVIANGQLSRYTCANPLASIGAKVEVASDGGVVRVAIPTADMFGRITSVKTILDDDLVEVSNGEGTQIVRAFGLSDLKEGDRIVLDVSGSLIVRKLPEAPPVVVTLPEVNRVTWAQIGGHKDAKLAIEEAVVWPTLHGSLLEAYGQRPPKGILFYGPPGCGKTLLAKATATAIADAAGPKGVPGFFSVRGPELLNAYVGETERAIRELFKVAREHTANHGTRAVVFVDEADSCLGPRGQQLHFDISVPAFLVEMDGIDGANAPLVILATNRAADLDEAIVREGRIDRRIEIKRPEAEDVKELFQIYLKSRPTKDAVDVLSERGALAIERSTLWANRSGAMVATLVDRATSIAMYRDITAKAEKPSGITMKDLGEAIIETAQSRQLRSSL